MPLNKIANKSNIISTILRKTIATEYLFVLSIAILNGNVNVALSMKANIA